ncbi:sphingosine 1-phosphate receptor 1 isoform X8 [Strigops habroptila]|uniref:sphingosine 1-phosphate receptor 1 isoform X8 n=2 Tax=Strigops habroptila TaxID=2489341 RepID=UPI0011CEE30C|nr:sphingosine 1-phosphate receptor 1 isoform X8 [Strigops habroptila]
MAAAERTEGSCPVLPLASGRSIPVLGLGTSHRGGYSHDAVVYAIQNCGIRHIDTAKRYGCESLLQKAIKESGVKREDLWLTTKLWHSDYGYENTKKACLESCERLGVEYLDLFLIHWPDAQIPGKSNREVRAETWRAMEELYEKGLCRSIGVSNFLISHLEQLKEDCVITPHVNQVFDFAIAEDDVEVLNGMHDGRHVSWDPSLVVQFQSRVLKGPAYTLDFCGVFHRKTSFLNTSCGQWGGTEERVPVLLVGMEYNPGVKHLTKHSPAYFW